MSEEKKQVLLVTLEERNSEQEYHHYCYFENSDEENKPSDMYILGHTISGFTGLDEDDLADRKELMGEEDYLSGEFWTDDGQRLVSVYSFEMVSEKEIEVLKKLTGVPLINEEGK